MSMATRCPANERPRQFKCDEDTHEIAAIEVRRQHPEVEFFQVSTTDDKRYVLRYDAYEDEWRLQSDFDGPELFARPGIDVVTVGAAQIREAARRIDGCEHCRPDETEIPFDWILGWILGEVTGRSGMVDFLIPEPGKCPKCFREVEEKTLVEGE